jgi:hypothetical protein
MSAHPPDARSRNGRAGWTAVDAWSLLALLFFLAGTVTLILTWYKIAGLALVAEQLPYLASGGFGGLALVIAGAGCLSAGRAARIEARLVDLLSIATEPVSTGSPSGLPDQAAGAGAKPDGPVLTITGGTTYHRPDCRLVAGKETSSLSLGEAIAQGLTPCPVCH